MLKTFTLIGGHLDGKTVDLDPLCKCVTFPIPVNITDLYKNPPKLLDCTKCETYVRQWVSYDEGRDGDSFFALKEMDVYLARRLFIHSTFGVYIDPPKPPSMVSRMLDSADDDPNEMLRRILKKAQRHFSDD